MKKHRKQRVNVFGEKLLTDVPVDDELYKADNHAEYQRARSKDKDRPFGNDIFSDVLVDVAMEYEERRLKECLREALQSLSEQERKIVELHYYGGLTEQETADMLSVSQQTVNKKKHRLIRKLRNILIDWI